MSNLLQGPQINNQASVTLTVENSATTATSEHSNTDQQTVSTNESVFEYTAEPLIQDSIHLEPNTEMIQTISGAAM